MAQRTQNSVATQADLSAERRFDRINMAVLSAQVVCWAFCLEIAPSLAGSLWLPALIVFFCLMMQGVFSMMHECFHGHGHRNSRLNALMCWLSSTIFGASATLIRINHLGHHVRNRTRAELVDYIESDESATQKITAYYFAIFGGIWLASFLGSLVLAVLPASATAHLRGKAETNTYAAAFADFTARDFQLIRYEVLAGVFFWVAAIWLLDLRLMYVLFFYAAFAFSWSSLQWIYHVRTPLDVVEGTYNLRAPFPIRALFLNFNYNLTHHRDPGLRWQRMHRVTNLSETRPLWFSWLSILRPPAPLPKDGVIEKSYF